MIKKLLADKNYISAISAVLKLNLPIMPVINLIPTNKVKQIVSELNQEILNIFLKQLGNLAV